VAVNSIPEFPLDPQLVSAGWALPSKFHIAIRAIPLVLFAALVLFVVGILAKDKIITGLHKLRRPRADRVRR
jgi:hypothetical protein